MRRVKTAPKPRREALAAIPASVRYDGALRPNAKLLYGEIMALACDKGYCWASNAHLGERYGISGKTVEAILRQLEDRHYICRGTVRDEKTNKVVLRKIWPIAPIGAGRPRPLRKEETSPQNGGDPPLEIEGGNQKEEYIPPISPAGGGGRKDRYALAEDAKPVLRAYAGEDRQLAGVLADFVAHRQEVGAVNSKRAITSMLRELDRLSGGQRANKLILLDHAMSAGWKTVYPVGDRRQEPPPEPVTPEKAGWN